MTIKLIEQIPFCKDQGTDVYLVSDFMGAKAAPIYVCIRSHKAIAYPSLFGYMNNLGGQPLCIEKYKEGSALEDLLNEMQRDYESDTRKTVEQKFEESPVH